MVYSPTGSSDLFLNLVCKTLNFLYLSLSTFYSTSLWRTDTIVFAKLNKPHGFINPPEHEGKVGLYRGFSVFFVNCSLDGTPCKPHFCITFLLVLVFFCCFCFFFSLFVCFLHELHVQLYEELMHCM